jgi:hypothetical protein
VRRSREMGGQWVDDDLREWDRAHARRCARRRQDRCTSPVAI